MEARGSSLNRHEKLDTPGSKRKACTPLSKKERNVNQESFLLNKRNRDSILRQERDDDTDAIPPAQKSPSSIISIEQPTNLQNSFQNILSEDNQVYLIVLFTLIHSFQYFAIWINAKNRVFRANKENDLIITLKKGHFMNVCKH